MSEVLLMEDHPAGCTVCMAVAGPFAVFKLAGWIVQTVEGPLQVDTEIALCAARAGREGCAGQVARVVGYVAADEAENLRSQYADVLAQMGELQTVHDALQAKTAVDRAELAREVAEEIIARAG